MAGRDIFSSAQENATLPGHRRKLSPVVPPGTLLQGRWRVSRDLPLYEDEIATLIKVRDIKDSKDVCMKIYRETDPYTVQKFRRSVEVLLTFRGRFTSEGHRVEGSDCLDLLHEELRAHTSFVDYASGQSFLTHMDFRHAFAELISFSHDAEWMPALDPASSKFFIVMELPTISLREKLTQCIRDQECMTSEEINQAHWALVCMVCGLMTEGYLHLDINPTSIFRCKNAKGKDVWKLIDLDGVAKTDSQMRFQDVIYAFEYTPPELAKLYLATKREGGRVKLSRTMNVWSIGMCMMEVAALMPVYNHRFSWYEQWKQENRGAKFLATVAGEKPGLGVDKLLSKELREALQFISPHLLDLMERILVKEEKHRLSITQCLLHKWFAKPRKQVHDARWGVDDEEEEDEEDQAGGDRAPSKAIANGGAGDAKKKKKKKKNPEDDLLPVLETNEQLRRYIRAQVEGRAYKPGEHVPSGPSISSVRALAFTEDPPPLMLPELPVPPPEEPKKSKVCAVM